MPDGNLERRQRATNEGRTAVHRLRGDLYRGAVAHGKANKHAGIDRLWIAWIEADAYPGGEAVLLWCQAAQCRGRLNERRRHLTGPTLVRGWQFAHNVADCVADRAGNLLIDAALEDGGQRRRRQVDIGGERCRSLVLY